MNKDLIIIIIMLFVSGPPWVCMYLGRHWIVGVCVCVCLRPTSKGCWLLLPLFDIIWSGFDL